MGLVNIREYPYPDEFVTLKDAWEYARKLYMHLNEEEYGAAEELENAFADLCVFKTINCPAGTDPVADQRTDTLNLTASGPMVITGTASSDTVDFDWAHLGIENLADPAADAFLKWNNTTNVVEFGGGVVSVSAGTGISIGSAGTYALALTASLSHLGIESLTDPNANKFMAWDDTDNALKFISYGTNLTFDHATYTLNASGGASAWTVDGSDLYWDGGGHVSIGSATGVADMTEGLYIYQGASDDKILAFGSSDIAHGMTTVAETQVYGYAEKLAGATGGLLIVGLGDSMDGLTLRGLVTTDVVIGFAQTHAAVTVSGSKASGTGTAAIADGDTLFAVCNPTYPKFMVSGDGGGYFDTKLFVGHSEVANTFMTEGITINQGGADNEILALKSSDVTHGVTTETETDTYGYVKKVAGATGGLGIFGIGEGTSGVNIVGVATTAETTHGDGAAAPILLKGRLKSGTTWGAVSAEGNVVVIANHATEIWGCDAEGDTWQSGNVTMGQILQLTHASATVIRPSVDSGQMTIYGSVNQNEGAKIEFFGGDHSTYPGNIYLDYGDFTKAAPATSKFYIRYMNNGGILNAIICNNSGNVFLPTIKNGATQAGAGAAANEIWKTASHATLPDNVLMIGV